MRLSETSLARCAPRIHCRFFTWAAMVALAGQRIKNRSILATMYGCSRQTVRRVQCSVALVMLLTQVVTLRKILKCVDHIERQPSFFGQVDAWDETGERVALNLISGATLEQQSSVWQVMVSKVSFCFGWIAENDQQWEYVTHMDIIIPPIPLFSASAANIYYGLVWHPTVTVIRKLLYTLMMKCLHKFKFREYDGAPANDTLSAHLLNEDVSLGVTTMNSACGNHANVLAQNAVLVTSYATPTGPKFNLLNDLYASSLFMRMGFFIKLIAAIPVIMQRDVRIVKESPPPGAKTYTQEMIKYCLSTFRFNRPQSISSSEMTSPSIKVFKKYYEELMGYFGLFNGGGRKHQGFPIYSSGKSLKRQASVDKLISHARRVVLPHLPTVPSSSKWTRLPPCIDFHIVANHYNLLSCAANEACHGIDYLMYPEKYSCSHDDPWKGDAGNRYKRQRQLLGCDARGLAMRCLAIVLEPIRMITHMFMSYGRSKGQYRRYPPIMDLIWPRKSIIVMALQYLTTLLHFEGSRLALVWAHSSSSLTDWENNFPEQKLYLRRMILVAISVLRYRHRQFDTWALQLFGVGDQRRSLIERMQLANRFKSLNSCCVPAGLRDLANSASVDLLVSNYYSKILIFTGWLLKVSIISLEGTLIFIFSSLIPNDSRTFS